MSDSRMPQRPQAAEQVLAPESPSVLTPEQLTFIQEQIGKLKDDFSILDSDKSTPKEKKDAKEEVAQIVNAILTDSGLSDVKFNIQTEADKTTQKIVIGAIKQLKLPTLPESLSENGRADQQAKLDAIKEQLTEIKQGGQPMDWKAKGALFLAGSVVAVSAIGGGISAMQQGQQKDLEYQQKSVEMKDRNEITTNKNVSILVSGGMVEIVNAERVNSILETKYSDGMKIPLTQADMVKLGGGPDAKDTLQKLYAGKIPSTTPTVRDLVDPVAN